MKIAERISIIVDILVAALHADEAMTGQELEAARSLLADLLLTTPNELPSSVEQRIQHFDLGAFDVVDAAAEFMKDPPMKKRRLLELVAALTSSDGVVDSREDDFLRALAVALDMKPSEYADLVLEYEIEELRDSFQDLLRSTMPEPDSDRAREGSIPPPIPKSARVIH